MTSNPAEAVRAKRAMLGSYVISLGTLGIVPFVQFGTFVLCGWMLGLVAFGQLIIFQASVAIFVEVAGVGMSEILIRNVARDPSSYGRSLSNFLTAMVPSGLLAIVLNTIVLATMFGLSTAFTIGLAFGAFEIATQRILMMWEHAAIAHHHTRQADAIRLLPALVRLLTIGLLYVLGLSTLWWIAAGFIASGVVSSAIASTIMLTRYGMPASTLDRRSVKDGIPFALNQLIRALQYNLDRLVLNLVLSPAQVAVYATAMKFVQVGGTPVSAMLRMWYPRIFKAGHESVGELIKLSRRLIPPAAAASGFSAIALMLFAPLIPTIMGQEFSGSVVLLQWGAPVLVVTALGYLGADILSGTGRQYLRAGFFCLAVALQCAIILALGRWVGPFAALLGFYLSAATMAALCWAAVFRSNKVLPEEAIE